MFVHTTQIIVQIGNAAVLVGVFTESPYYERKECKVRNMKRRANSRQFINKDHPAKMVSCPSSDPEFVLHKEQGDLSVIKHTLLSNVVAG